MNYTTLSLPELSGALESVARDTMTTFSHLNARQLNWRADATRWSVAQCFEHLLTANDQMLREARSALAGPPSLWQRVPMLPGLFGPALIRSQEPTTTRKYKAPRTARPATSDIPSDILERFATQQRDVANWIQTLDERHAARAIMGSPFLAVITYSVLDGCRLLVAHDHRHFEQARRVTLSAEFPPA